MSDKINQIASRLISIIDTRSNFASNLTVHDLTDAPIVERTLSNTLLLFRSLETFYSDPKSDFFPTSISTSIRERLIQVESTIAGFTEESIAPDAALGLLKTLEDLFVYCLQYGVITYGFKGKVAQEQVELIRRTRQQTEAAAQEMLAELGKRESEIKTKLETFENSLAQAETDFNTKVSGQLDALQPTIDSLSALLAGGQTDSEEIKKSLEEVKQNATAVGQARADLDAAATAATAESTARKATAEGELATIQTLGLQVQKFESEAKAMHQTITDAKANMSEQLAQITTFYGEIEKHRLMMTEAGKGAQSQFAELNKNADQVAADLLKRTKDVVSTNESLIEEIKDHLRKAIGASLFTAFDKRRQLITISSWIWATLLLASIGGTIWFAFWFVSEVAKLTTVSEASKLATEAPASIQWIVVYARLVIVAPLAFLITFTAKRYTSERRAEEEWAFKSAISISLDPFRDLIARMKEANQDTVFVEKLVAEVFDNPARRLYAVAPEKEEKDGANFWSLMKEALDKIPKAKKD
ncbi:MAG: ATP synthase subunit B family protein [Prosthecobacter sp.]